MKVKTFHFLYLVAHPKNEKHRRIGILIMVMAVMVACNKLNPEITEPPVEPYTTYVIKAGQQFCTPNPRVITTDSVLNFIAVSDSSCIYVTADPSNQSDINKLYGFSDFETDHLENSARIGWRWTKDSLQIFAFAHNNGSIVSKEITTPEPGKYIICNIACKKSQYSFTANEKSVTLPRYCSGYYTGISCTPVLVEIKQLRMQLK